MLLLSRTLPEKVNDDVGTDSTVLFAKYEIKIIRDCYQVLSRTTLEKNSYYKAVGSASGLRKTIPYGRIII